MASLEEKNTALEGNIAHLSDKTGIGYLSYDDQGPFPVEKLFKENTEGSPNKAKPRKFCNITRKIFSAPADTSPLCGGLTEGHNVGKLCANRDLGISKHTKKTIWCPST